MKKKAQKQAEASHTPTPFRIIGKPGLYAIVGPEWPKDGLATEQYVASIQAGDNEKANAAFIVRACNAHDELVEFADWVLRCAKFKGPHGTTLYAISDEMMDKGRAALKKAEGR